jgi:hypothetical protein
VAQVQNARTNKIETWVATERTRLPEEWKGGNSPLRGERYIYGEGHAEAAIMSRLGNDWKINVMAASTRMCPNCHGQAVNPPFNLVESNTGRGYGTSSTDNTVWRVVKRK